MNQRNSVIVISYFSGKRDVNKGNDLDWVNKCISLGFHTFVYDHVISRFTTVSPYFVKGNKGREASVYLRYIIDFYDSLQPYTIFLQEDEYSWHHKGSLIDLIKGKIDKKNMKYHNFNNRCFAMIKGSNLFFLMNEYFEKCLRPYIGDIERYGDWTAGYPCCSQFVVHRKYIRRYPKEMYEKMFKFMMDGRHNEKSVGNMFEWTLHLLYDNPYLIHNMSEEKFLNMMKKRQEKIKRAQENKEQVFFDGCRVIMI